MPFENRIGENPEAGFPFIRSRILGITLTVTVKTYDALLQNIRQVTSLSVEEQEFLVSRMKVKAVKKRRFILQAGDICQHRTFVVKGLLRSYYEDAHGGVHIVKFAAENWWIEDLMSFLTGQPASLNIDALEDSELLQIKKGDLEEVYLGVPAMEKYFRVELEKYAIAQQERVLMNMSMNAREKYVVFRQRCHHLTQRVPQHYIASFLGFTPQFLSQIRAQKADDINSKGAAIATKTTA